ncbi:MAG: dTDP-4-dehydrorhamnose reductase [Patescibacteria group bacterium]
MRILLLGKNGMLGQALFNELVQDNDVHGYSHADCDITNPKKLEKVIKDMRPEVVINATGYTQVDKAEIEKDAAFAVNAVAVGHLCKILAKTAVPLVHFSTDYVFDGTKTGGYEESDPMSPISIYGASKAEGEKEILNNLKNFFLIRTAWLYGSGGRNFVDAMIGLSSRKQPIKVVNDQFGNPTLTTDLANAISRLLKTKNYGIYHLVNDGSCSWYDFTLEIFHQLGLPQEVIPITSEELARPAKRPKNSILINSKFPKLRPWKEALSQYLEHKQITL